jgi:molybdopterin-guanine dinucleotide biosynthesis protein A
MAAFTGAILTGGASRRMGQDKAFVRVDGTPMVLRVATALHGAGAVAVVAVGGDLSALAALGLDARADPRQGQGPLAGTLSALEHSGTDVVVVVATDLYALDAATVTTVVDALDRAPHATVAVATTTHRQPLCAAWRRTAAAGPLAAAYGDGVRALRRALERVPSVEVGVDPAVLVDADFPDDLPDNLEA